MQESTVKRLEGIREEERERIRRNPLAAYSTLQLKREIRRRKRQKISF